MRCRQIHQLIGVEMSMTGNILRAAIASFLFVFFDFCG